MFSFLRRRKKQLTRIQHIAEKLDAWHGEFYGADGRLRYSGPGIIKMFYDGRANAETAEAFKCFDDIIRAHEAGLQMRQQRRELRNS